MSAAETLAVGFDPRAGFVTVVVDPSITPGTYKLTRKALRCVIYSLC
jgi:hypothetical protein